ncbi:MAG: UrcA family protein [Erythrobacter sp.]
MIKYTATAAALGLALITTPVMAEQNTTQSIAVEYRDLNLSTPEGQAKLDKRVDRAAAQVCGLTGIRTGTRVRSSSSKKCYAKARKSVEKQVAGMIAETQRGG